MADPIIGIDLGTSNSSVAVVDEHGRAQVLRDAKGRAVVPSIVSFHPSGEVLVGHDAKHRRGNDPRNTIFSIKRILGRPYTATEVGEARNRSPFAIYKGEGDRAQVVTRAGKFTPEEISALILDHMRKLAATALGQPVERAVITVPANFNEAQRQATAAAAEIAGIVAVRLLNEPTAAALAYGHGRPPATRQHLVVYDFGGGTFDVSVLRLDDDVYEVLATAGDMFLGGDDLDNRLVEHEVREFLATHHVDLRADPQVVERLRATIEDAKHELSTKMRAVVLAEGIAAGAGGAPIDLSTAITREQFTGLIKDIIERTFPVLDEALRRANLRPADVDDVLLVGGTTRIPYVRQRVAEYFGKPPRTDVDPDQAVALGAAIQGAAFAALLDGARPAAAPPRPAAAALGAASPRQPPALPPPRSGDRGPTGSVPLVAGGEEDPDVPTSPVVLGLAASPALRAPRLVDVTPQALSVATVSGFCEVLVRRHERVPHEVTREFTTAHDEQSSVEIVVVVGDSRRLEENRPLGTLVLEGLPPRPRGDVRILVTFALGEDGILVASALDVATGIAQSARMNLDGALSQEAIAEARSRFSDLRR